MKSNFNESMIRRQNENCLTPQKIIEDISVDASDFGKRLIRNVPGMDDMSLSEFSNLIRSPLMNNS